MKSVQAEVSFQRTIIIDLIVLFLVVFVPAISHILPFPVYFIDPMRIMLFIGFLLSKSTQNGILLAIVIPLFSMIVTGHPILYKACLISAELSFNIWLFVFLKQKFSAYTYFAIISSIVASKVFYYLLKYAFLSLGLISGSLISTSILIQVFVLAILSLAFTKYYNKNFQ